MRNHTDPQGAGAVRAAALILTVFALGIGFAARAQGPDLPFSSGSTGADGPFKWPFAPGFSPGRAGLGLAYDALRRVVVLHGGNGSSTIYQALNETLVWDGAGWRSASTAGPKVIGCAMAYDAERGEVVLFGGATATTSVSAETWTWNGTTWTLRQPAVSPPGRGYAAMVFDAARKRVLLFGGWKPDTYSNDMWSWDGQGWTEVKPAHAPTPRGYAGIAFDRSRQQVVLFGGYDSGGIQGTHSGETWIWDGTDWSRPVLSSSPGSRYAAAMAYDEARNRVVMFGGYPVNRSPAVNLDDTWLWDGNTWSEVTPEHRPRARRYAGMTWDGARERVLLAGGYGEENLDDALTWDGSDWATAGGNYLLFDMNAKPDGVWNFTTIDIPAGTSMKFRNNAANTPIRWLATGNVTIAGRLDLSGENGDAHPSITVRAEGGPGGYAGGLGRNPLPAGAADAQGRPGEGPGGGAPGPSGGNGVYVGNSYLQPLVGGSGGGGGLGPAGQGTRGPRGGGGGGAIRIASSRDIVITGTIIARGGVGESVGPYNGGSGSGGAIHLQADRIAIGSGLNASSGIIRVESYYRTLEIGNTPVPILAAPTALSPFDSPIPWIRIADVAGKVVVQPPKGDPLNPDVVFSAPGEVVVTIRGDNLPDGTSVRLRLTSAGTTLIKPAPEEAKIRLVGGSATIAVNVPKGAATLQAFADLP